MELKKLKRINNSLPKFDEGTDYWSGMGNPLGDGWNQYTKESYGGTVTNPGTDYWYGGGYSYRTPVQNKLQPSNIGEMITNPSTNPIRSIQINPEYRQGVLDNDPRSSKEWKGDPKSNAGLKTAAVIGGVANIAGGFIGQNAVKSSDELLANAGLSQGNVMGISYQRQNDINADEEMSAVTKSGISNTISSVATGASAGAAFGPIGAAVGGVVGGITGLIGLGTSKHKLRKRIENARITAQRRNTYNMSTAMSAGLQQDYYTNNASGGLLYANDGKDLINFI